MTALATCPHRVDYGLKEKNEEGMALDDISCTAVDEVEEVEESIESSDPDYDYEDAAPEVHLRNQQNRACRRNSLVGSIMTWAGAIRDDDFYGDKTQTTRVEPSEFAGINRRASLDGATTAGTTQRQSLAQRKRLPSSDDIILLDQGDQDWRLGDEADGESDSMHLRHADPALRRNSLHAMVERAMAYVNLTRHENDDDLSPFGNRRDSLF